MKRILTIWLLLIAGFSFAFGQSSSDSITIKKGFGGNQYYQNDQVLKLPQMVKIMKLNEQASKEIKTAQSTYTLASILGGAGGFMLGWPIGTALGGGEPNWTMAGIGAGLLLVSIPINQKFNTQVKTAVDTFNGDLPTSSFFDKSELKLAFTNNGFGLSMRF